MVRNGSIKTRERLPKRIGVMRKGTKRGRVRGGKREVGGGGGTRKGNVKKGGKEENMRREERKWI